ncbi:hypothetical protein C4J83_5318 [Pseudomonas sp. LBUM920]|nr:hypothetical protein C4J83_5318 [Pseudomonas sp. LBUM920]
MISRLALGSAAQQPRNWRRGFGFQSASPLLGFLRSASKLARHS